MAWYRLYFLGFRGDIRNVDEFDVANDNDALIMADIIHDAVRDIYVGWELWQGSRRVFHCANEAAPRPNVSQAITSQMQANILRREEILQESRTAFARSARLLERMREVREILGSRRRHSEANNKRHSATNSTSLRSES